MVLKGFYKKTTGIICCLFLALQCFALDVPPLKGRINDNAKIMLEKDIVELTSLLENIEEKTGVQIAVLTIPSLEGDELNSYSLNVAQKWGLGQKENDNGVLFLVALKEHEVRIEVGYGLEGLLNDSKCGRILRNAVIPEFKNENYSEGISLGVRNICGYIAEDIDLISDSVENDDYKSDENLAYIIMFLVFLFMIMMSKGGIFKWIFLSKLFGNGRYYSGNSRNPTSVNRTNFGGIKNFGGSSFNGFSGGGGHFGGGGASGKW